jgi:oligopeptide/dipeptide ABC transporter ATP-binding protein
MKTQSKVMQMSEKKEIINVKNLKKWFQMKGQMFSNKKSFLKAVDDVSFSLNAGETLGIVGESGCGKTTVGRTLMRIYQPTCGEFWYDEKLAGQPVDIFKLKDRQMQKIRSHIQMVFQDPYASLNPRMTVQDIISEGLRVNKLTSSKKETNEKIADIMEKVGLRPEYMKRYPHEFSGGQRQRIGIARVMIMKPKVVICDEPVSALDVSVQAQIINLLEDLKHEFDLTYLFIAHDLSVVKHISDKIAVMYLGKIVESAYTDTLFENSLHPYTQGLLHAIPIPNPHTRRMGKRILITGDIPSPVDPPEGCRFAKRCPKAFDRCFKETPILKEKEKNHNVACFLY